MAQTLNIDGQSSATTATKNSNSTNSPNKTEAAKVMGESSAAFERIRLIGAWPPKPTLPTGTTGPGNLPYGLICGPHDMGAGQHIGAGGTQQQPLTNRKRPAARILADMEYSR